MKKKHIKGIEARKSHYGFMFILPWVIGFVLFFFIPIIQSFVYSLSSIKITDKGLTTNFIAFDNYLYLIKEDPDYFKLLQSSIVTFLYSLPLIMIISMVLAIVLNQKFKGRVIFRALFFLPVIIASGVVMDLIFTTTSDSSTALGVSDSITANMFSVESIIQSLDLPVKIAMYIQTAVSSIFDLIWSCGIQIILFISGLQGIPEQLYEVSRVEGATKWEEFWYITIPMLKDVILLVLVYTMIALFTALDNPVIEQAYTLMKGQQVYDQSSAMLWGYFAVVGAIMAVVLLIYNRFCLKKWG